MAGIIAGNASGSSGAQFFRTVKGMAPSVKLINLHVSNNSGIGNDSAVIAAIQRAIALKSQYNIRVINLSLGRPVTQSYTKDPLN